MTRDERSRVREEYLYWFRLAENDTSGSFGDLLRTFAARLKKSGKDAFRTAEEAQGWFKSELDKNPWWRSLTDEERSSLRQEYNPLTSAGYRANVSDRADLISERARKLGFNLDAGTLQQLAVRAQRENWTEVETDRALRPLAGKALEDNATNEGLVGSLGKTAADLANWSRLNGIEIDQATADRMLSSVAFGDMTYDQVKATLRKQYMVGAFPGWREQIEAGLDVYDLSAPYRSVAQRMLGESNLTLSDNRLKAMMQVQNADGTMGIRPIYEAEKYIRSLPEWQYTDDAYATYTNAGIELGRMFGFR